MKEVVRRLVPRAVRNALRCPWLTLAWFRDETAWRLGRTSELALREGFRVRVHPASVVPFRLHCDDEELRREMDSFVALCHEDMVLMDIGAHYGVFTLAALRYGGPRARVIAVEPSPEASRILRINVGLATAGDRVQVLQAAAGAADGELAMLTTGPLAAHYVIGIDGDRPDATRIPQLTLESILARTGVVPTHVKIDVEGFEGEVLEGGQRILKEHRPVVLLELHGRLIRERGRSPAAVLARLAGLGYRRLERDGEQVDPDAAAGLEIVRLVCRPVEREAESVGPSSAS